MPCLPARVLAPEPRSGVLHRRHVGSARTSIAGVSAIIGWVELSSLGGSGVVNKSSAAEMIVTG